MNATQSYSSRAAYVTWNFGNFSGTIKGSFSGNLIAPKATFDGVEIRSGRVVANNVSHSGELHMAVKGTYKTENIHRNSESHTQSESTTQLIIILEIRRQVNRRAAAQIPIQKVQVHRQVNRQVRVAVVQQVNIRHLKHRVQALQ